MELRTPRRERLLHPRAAPGPRVRCRCSGSTLKVGTPPVVARSNSKDGSLIHDESGRSRTDTGARSRGSSGEREGVLRPETSGRLSQASGAPPEEVAMVATKMLNRVITKYSEGSSLVMTNLPMPTIESGQTPAAYMRIIDALTEDIPLCILVAGQKDANVVTMYS